MLRSRSAGMSRRHDQPTWGTTSLIGDKRKQDAREIDTGEISTLDRILRSLNNVKSEVGGFRKLLLDHGFTQEDPTPSTKQRRYAAACKENGQEPKPRFQRQENVLQQLRRPRPRIRHPGRLNHSYLSGKNFLPTVNLRTMSALTWHWSRKLRRRASTTGQ
jgi:hypothetical protein